MATLIPPVPNNQPVVDKNTSMISQVWSSFFNDLWTRAGGSTAQTNLELGSAIANQAVINELTGDIKAGPVTNTGPAVATIQPNVVTNAKLSQMPADTIKGNNGLLGNALDLTPAQVNALLPVFTSLLNGLVPASGGGTDNFLRADGAWASLGPSPSGSIIMYGGSTAPSGWLICDGSAISRTTFVGLFTIIGTTYGVGDGSTTFNLPDTRGVFIRGAGTSGKLSNANGSAFSGTLGTYQDDQIQGHFHTMPSAWGFAGSGSNNAPTVGTLAGVSETTGPANDGTNGTPRIGEETNPANICLNYIIKE